MAGAAQAIGWILQVDDRVSDVLDKISTKAVDVGKAIAESVKVDLTPAFEQVHSRFSDMGAEMQGGFQGTSTVLSEIRDALTGMDTFMREFLSVDTIQDIVDMLRPLFVDLKDTVQRMQPAVQEAREATKEAGDIFGTGMFSRWNRFWFRAGFFFKTLQIAVWRPIKNFLGAPLRLLNKLFKTIRSVVGLVTGMIKPLTALIKAPFFKLIGDIMDVISFALKPFFMQLRIALIPFIVIFVPMLQRAIFAIMSKYVIPFVIEWLPKIEKGFQTIWTALFGREKEAKKAWKDIKAWVRTAWDGFRTDSLVQLEKWSDELMVWVGNTAMPAVQETVSGWFSGEAPGASKGGIMGEIFDVIGRLFGVFVKTGASLLAPLGVVISEFGKGTWKLLKPWLKKEITDFAIWFRDVGWPPVKAWIIKAIGELWVAAGDEALKILPEGAATLLGFKKPIPGDVTGLATPQMARLGISLKKKETAGILTQSESRALQAMRNLGVKGLQEGGLVEGTPDGHLAIIGERGTTEGVIPLGRDVPRDEAVRMMQAAVAAASMARGEAPAGTDGQTLGVLKSIESFLAMIADNTEDSAWMNDPDFEQGRDRKAWQT